MKSLKIMGIGLLSFLAIGIANVKADTIDVVNEDNLKSCIETSGNICKLTNDITATTTIEIKDGVNVVVDLNSHNITFEKNKSFLVQGASLEVTGEGEIKEKVFWFSPITLKGNAEGSESKTKVVIGEGVTLNGWAGLFIDQSKTENDTPTNSNIEAEINGKVYGNNDGSSDGLGIYVNGVIKSKTNKVTIGENAYIDGKNGFGIYAAGNAVWDITGATIKGAGAGIGIKAGTLNLKDANVSSNGEDSTPTEGYSNGINASGAAIQIESNKGYAGDIEINIDGGTYISENSVVLYEYLDSKTTDTTVKSINVENGTFTSGAGKNVILTSKNFADAITKFIEGGTFSSDVTTYVKDGFISRKISDTSYVVGKEYKINVDDNIINGTVSSNINKGIVNDDITLTIEPDTGYRLQELIVKDADNNVITVNNNIFKMPKSDVIINATFSKIDSSSGGSSITTEFPTIDTTETPKTEIVGVKNGDETSKVLLDTLSDYEELKNAITGIDAVISLDINKIQETDADVEKVTQALKAKKLNNAIIGNFFDITINVKDSKTNTVIGTLSELKDAIELVVLLPEELKNVHDGYTRTYYIVRNHNGVMEVLDTKLSEDKKSLIFRSDKFSTYAIAYVDNKISNSSISKNPQTSDNIMNNIAMLAVSVLGFSTFSIVCFKNKRKHN